MLKCRDYSTCVRCYDDVLHVCWCSFCASYWAFFCCCFLVDGDRRYSFVFLYLVSFFSPPFFFQYLRSISSRKKGFSMYSLYIYADHYLPTQRRNWPIQKSHSNQITCFYLPCPSFFLIVILLLANHSACSLFLSFFLSFSQILIDLQSQARSDSVV